MLGNYSVCICSILTGIVKGWMCVRGTRQTHCFQWRVTIRGGERRSVCRSVDVFILLGEDPYCFLFVAVFVYRVVMVVVLSI